MGWGATAAAPHTFRTPSCKPAVFAELCGPSAVAAATAAAYRCCRPRQLSAHQIATELGPSSRLGPPGWYSGELLSLAHDLGKRLLPAFDTPLGIPVHRVNLQKGIPRGAVVRRG